MLCQRCITTMIILVETEYNQLIVVILSHFITFLLLESPTQQLKKDL